MELYQHQFWHLMNVQSYWLQSSMMHRSQSPRQASRLIRQLGSNMPIRLSIQHLLLNRRLRM